MINIDSSIKPIQIEMQDLQIIENTIQDLRESSFQHLMTSQLSLVDNNRFDFNINEMTTISNNGKLTTKKYSKIIEGDFVHSIKRNVYRKSNLYGKELSVYELANNSKIFHYTFMAFIDGKFTDTVKIIPHEDKSFIILNVGDKVTSDTLPKNYFNELKVKNARVTVFFIPNCSYGVYQTNRADLLVNKEYLSLKRFNLSGSLDTDIKYLTFVNENDLLFTSVITDTTNSTQLLKFVNNTANLFSNKVVHLNIFGFRSLYDQIDIGIEKFFKVPLMDMPIPPENMMIFRKLPTGGKEFAHDISIKMFYPDIYEIIGNDLNEELSVLVFYSNVTANANSTLVNEIKVFEEIMGDSLSLFKNNTIPALIRDYKPETLIYNIEEYTNSIDYDDHSLYKLRKLSDWVDRNPNLMQAYYRNKMKTSNGYYIDIEDIDLLQKIRHNNHLEIDNISIQEVFNEERYLFILRNENIESGNDIRFFIDGNLYTPDKRWKNSKYYFYYIPTTLISNNSLIEVEYFSAYHKKLQITYSTIGQAIPIIIPENKKIYPNDIYLVDQLTTNFIPKNYYRFYYINKRGKRINVSTTSFVDISGMTLYIEMANTTLLLKTLDVYIEKSTRLSYHKIIEGVNDDYGIGFTINQRMNPDKSYFRIFRNGRLLPHDLYEIEMSETYNGITTIIPRIVQEIGDEFIVDFTPVSYKIIYQRDNIPFSGVIDLNGMIENPLDLNAFDFYVNGRRLSSKNINLLSPYIFNIKNIESIYNLVILEKNSNNDIISVAKDSTTIFDKLWAEIPELKKKFEFGLPELEDNELDIVSEIVSTRAISLKRMYERVIKFFGLFNPDKPQILKGFESQYNSVFIGNAFMFNPDPDVKDRKKTIFILPSIENNRFDEEISNMGNMLNRIFINVHRKYNIINPDLKQVNTRGGLLQTVDVTNNIIILNPDKKIKDKMNVIQIFPDISL